ncbi:hypothetical protein AAHC03_022915 [Spirometra sp. Aus1]
MRYVAVQLLALLLFSDLISSELHSASEIPAASQEDEGERGYLADTASHLGPKDMHLESTSNAIKSASSVRAGVLAATQYRSDKVIRLPYVIRRRGFRRRERPRIIYL